MKFFELKQSEKVVVLVHTPNQIHCGTLAFASVTIVRNNKGEIFRVLNLCNLEKFTTNQQINISPQKAPSFNVNFPRRYVVALENGNEVIHQITYDETILQTTWGSIEKIR